jgi:hypothetical protein
MTDEPPTEAPPEPPKVGWQVLDPDGNVVESGPWPAATLTAVGTAGDAEEESTDGSD